MIGGIILFTPKGCHWKVVGKHLDVTKRDCNVLAALDFFLRRLMLNHVDV